MPEIINGQPSASEIEEYIDTDEIATDLNTTHRGSDGSNHSKVGANETAIGLNNTHRDSDGSDHSKVGANETAIGLNTTHRGSDGSDHSLVAGAMSYTDRGDPDSWDFNEYNYAADGSWIEWDLSSIVGEAARLVLIRLEIRTSVADRQCQFRRKGITNIYNVVKRRTIIGGKYHYEDIWLYTNTSGIIEYNFQSGTWNNIYMGIKGWFE